LEEGKIGKWAKKTIVKDVRSAEETAGLVPEISPLIQKEEKEEVGKRNLGKRTK